MRALCLLTAMLLLALAGAAVADENEGAASMQGAKPAAMAMPMEHPAALPEGVNARLVEFELMPVAYLEGTLYGDMDELFGKLKALAEEQGLINENTMWGSLYPDDMSRGVDETTRIFVGITIDPEAEVAEPLLRGALPGGTYLMAEHYGDYAGLHDTYIALYTWAAENGVVFAIPTFEHYVNDPETTPVEDLLTEIYLPFDHEAMKAGYMTGDNDDGGGDDDDVDGGDDGEDEDD